MAPGERAPPPALTNEFVAVTVDGQNVLWRIGLLLDLAAQLDDKIVNRTIRWPGAESPDLLEDLIARDGLPAPLVEQPQQAYFVEGKLFKKIRTHQEASSGILKEHNFRSGKWYCQFTNSYANYIGIKSVYCIIIIYVNC